MKAACILSLLLSWISSIDAFGCMDSLPERNHIFIKGYLKQLQQVSFREDISAMQTGMVIHNRMQVLWKPLQHFTVRADCRNRVFYGEQVRSNPILSLQLENSNDYFDLSASWYKREAIVGHSTLDRLYINFTRNRWDISLGRQRINWGVSTLWTPNDIFNTYNFFDFDYEERPGSDALRIQYSPQSLAGFECAYKPGRHRDEHIGAILYRFNTLHYDAQIFAGILNADLSLGCAWAGNLKNAGFKSETTLLQPIKQLSSDTCTDILTTVTIDYAWKGGWYSGASYLYHRTGIEQFNSITGFYSTRLTLRSMMPFQHSFSIIISKAITPILSCNGVFIYSPTSHALITVPSLSHSPADNWEILLSGQFFLARHEDHYGTLGNNLYLRLKLTF